MSTMRYAVTLIGIAAIAPVAIAIFLMASMNIAATDLGRATSEAELELNSPAYNLATVIAFRAGLIRFASAEEVENIAAYRRDQGYPLKGGYWLPSYTSQYACEVSDIATGITVTESYLRSNWRRRTETQLAGLIETLTGGRPDWSYGVAQIKPSTGLRILEDSRDMLADMTRAEVRFNIDHGALARQLDETCASMNLVELSILTAPSKDSTARAHALRHVGGEGVPTIPGRVSYANVVGVLVDQVLEDAVENASGLSFLVQQQFLAQEAAAANEADATTEEELVLVLEPDPESGLLPDPEVDSLDRDISAAPVRAFYLDTLLGSDWKALRWSLCVAPTLHTAVTEVGFWDPSNATLSYRDVELAPEALIYGLLSALQSAEADGASAAEFLWVNRPDGRAGTLQVVPVDPGLVARPELERCHAFLQPA